MAESIRVEWHEGRDAELYFVIAEKSSGLWSFFERSSWELRWHPLASNRDRVAMAEAILAARGTRMAA